ncbi:hypothetical protein BC826DRAFT_524003 [Russula brevipes]|nr:hypothetical protein BC826DRAFT_524003 [Russula brevipes]
MPMPTCPDLAFGHVHCHLSLTQSLTSFSCYCEELVEKYGPRSLSCDKSKNPQPVDIADVIWLMHFCTRYASGRELLHPLWQQGGRSRVIALVMNLGLRDATSLGLVIAAALTVGIF